MRSGYCGSNPTGYFQLDDGRTHEVSIPLLKAHGVLENADEVETFRGEFYREQAYSLQGVEAISTLSEGMIYRLLSKVMALLQVKSLI